MSARVVVHVDMDAFFASVEQRDDPSLRGKPVLVGGGARRGVVAAASYEARRFGCRSAMPMAEAIRLCPDAVVVPPGRGRYEEASAEVFRVFHDYTPLVEGLSVDEAFLDVTASQSLFGDGRAIAEAIRRDVYAKTSLTASAGVAACKFVAKIASDMNKPDGLTVVPDDAAGFLAPLPVERMWGVGPKTAPMLRSLGYATLGDLARADRAAIERALGAWGPVAKDLARGIDTRPVVPEREAKSVGAEQTYDDDLTSKDAIARTLLAHASRVAERLVAEDLAAGAVMVKLKYADFTLLSRRRTLTAHARDATTLHEACLDLLERFPLPAGARVRLTGVAVYDLRPVAELPRTLFPDRRAERREELQRTLGAAKERFGGGAITFATLLGEEREPSHPTTRFQPARPEKPEKPPSR